MLLTLDCPAELSHCKSWILALRPRPISITVMVTTTFGRRVLLHKAIPMPDTIPTAQPTPAAPARLPVDLFFDQVIQAVHRHEARARLAEQLTGQPFRYDLSSTASFTGLPVPLLRRLCRSGELQAVKLAGWWLLHRDEFHRLLAPEVTLRSRAARQYIFLRNLQQLAAMLHRYDAESTLHVLLHDLRQAVMFREGGADYEDAEGMVWARAKWRVEDGIIDRDQTEDALRLVQLIIGIGLELFRDVGGRHANSRLVSMIAVQTGVDLGL